MGQHYIPYGRQLIGADDIAAVVEVLQSAWLTTGPKVTDFEKAVAESVGVRHGIAVTSGTAALHAAMSAIGIGPGDEVIVPALTFVATANCVVYEGGTPVFADVHADTLLIDPDQVRKKITPRTKAIIAVDYAGQPCDYDCLSEIAAAHKLFLVADGCHALGAEYRGRKVGSLADLTVFSFHPVKHITTGEGGMIVTDKSDLAERLCRFRNHGISSDHRQRENQGTWFYEMVDLGFNYRLSDIQCALGISQLKKLPEWLARRRGLARLYDAALADVREVAPLTHNGDNQHAYHLYVVRLAEQTDREQVFREMRRKNIGVNVHYLPVHLHAYYRNRYKTAPGLCPVAEKTYERILSLPMHAGLCDEDVRRVVSALGEAVAGAGR
ncbi:MAG: UDP-4-amino-4,6-dideoxy-N-acetyl-beta-L-altrosamine transaminase [Deltaproteobacteria bacterium]|nr:UDP-4-amino-4,6-dideoxy-N-acetyl-beta-L-altrosamine transaminase [Deltaproteobacteria bacterium]